MMTRASMRGATSHRERGMPSSLDRKRWKAVASYGGGAMAMFSITHQAFEPSTFRALVLTALFGFVVGALSAPVFEPKLFRKPEKWQAGLGAAGGALLAVIAGASLPIIATTAVTGAVLGALARHWVEYV